MAITYYVLNGRATKNHHLVCTCQDCIIEKIALKKGGHFVPTRKWYDKLEGRLEDMEDDINGLYNLG